METSEIIVCGLVTADERGLRKQKKLFLFGETFNLEWQDMKGWAIVSDGLASGQTGTEEHILSYLELQAASKLHQIQSSDAGGRFPVLVNYIRSRLPDKETQSVMEKVSNIISQMPPKP